MAYVKGVQYWYECACGWKLRLEPDLVPWMLVVACPGCKGNAIAVRRDSVGPGELVVQPTPQMVQFTLYGGH